MPKKKPAAGKTAKKQTADKPMKRKILEAALPDVAFDGWTQELLERACARLKLSPEEMNDALPGGATELVLYFSEWADARMLEELGDEKPERIRDRIALAVRTRLECLAGNKQAASAAMAHMALPPRGRHLPKMVWKTADRIWRWAGDTATDYNHYTKRLLLSGVLTATGFYWLNDDSPGNAKTWEFLDRRIERVLKLGQKLARIRRKKA
ncbi:MAG: COQ9 family protein [Alphaproteobacteria bacterium]|nr:COQ9 family protein [Alphaproteobacteria bacterium]